MSETEEKETTKPKRPILSKTRIFFLLVLIVMIGLIGFGSWSFYNYQQVKEEVVRLSTLEGQKELQEKEIDGLLNSVKKHMILPEGENPTVATITDIDALQADQPFFDNAINGDKVIIYVEARKAIIYSPEKDIVVNVGAIVVDNPEVDIDELTEESEEEPTPDEAEEELEEESEDSE